MFGVFCALKCKCIAHKESQNPIQSEVGEWWPKKARYVRSYRDARRFADSDVLALTQISQRLLIITVADACRTATQEICGYV